jgi:hypothetical protein
MAVLLGLATEVQITLGWFPGDRCARLLRAVGDGGKPLALATLASQFNFSLLKSGTSFPVDDLPTLARWGHFADPTFPWEANLQL